MGSFFSLARFEADTDAAPPAPLARLSCAVMLLVDDEIVYIDDPAIDDDIELDMVRSAGDARPIAVYSSQKHPASLRSCSSIIIFEQYMLDRASNLSASRTLRGLSVHLRYPGPTGTFGAMPTIPIPISPPVALPWALPLRLLRLLLEQLVWCCANPEHEPFALLIQLSFLASAMSR